MTQYFLKKMEQKDLADALQNELIGIQQYALKAKLRKKCHHVHEGIAKQGESTVLNKIYTELYITEGGAGQVNKEHEVRLIEKNNVTRDKNQMEQEVQIRCKDMFKPLAGQDKSIRTVLTQGVAGIGKSICVQKFILDWAEGKEYQDIQFIFPLPFRELNLKKGSQSLMDIIYFFFPETQGLRLSNEHKVMFIFDGLDECQLPLRFQTNETLNNISEEAPLDSVMTSLIKGNLLPSALIWITTRPAAAAKVPAEFIHQMTELRGFNDLQKEQYFRKRISDQDLAEKIIDHIKQSRSLFIMCHIPVFCWISANVLQRILQETKNKETPKTLTEMYTCFLIFQTIQGKLKYNGKNDSDTPWDKEGIMSMGKLAFHHLEESNLIFYREDLDTCGIDPSKMSVYSGLCTQETVTFLGTVYSFVHLSIQEFLAAIFAYISLRNDNKNVLEHQSESQESKKTEVIDLLKTAVDQALKSDHGHLDLFLRFLLGLSLESNEQLIRGLLTQKGSRSDCQKDIVEYIKSKFKENPSPERSVNLLYCLNELNDDSLVKEIQSYMSSGRLSEAELSPAQWSALVFVLLTSKEKLDVFDLKKFIRSDECLIRLLAVVKEATSALLSECNLTDRSCSALTKVLSSESSMLTELDLSGNPVQDRGVELLAAGLESANCKLEKLRLSECNLTDRSCSALTKVLSSESSMLTELDLSGNPVQDRGVELLAAGLESANCKLEKLRLSECNLTDRSCSALTKVLSSESSMLTELDLSGNPVQDRGVELLSAGLESANCKLEKLRLSFCSITEEGYAALASALKSNPSSHLIELDLRGNDPGDTGVKMLTDLLEDPNCKLRTIRLLKSPAAEDVCDFLTTVLGISPLLLRELDLSGKIQGDSELMKISDLLEDSHCRTHKLKLSKCSITEEGCAALSSALCSSPSRLIELDLSENKLGNSGVKHICFLLANQCCKLQKLNLSFCSITEEGYAALASALKSNPSSSLIVVDLRGNDPGNTRLKTLTDSQNYPRRKQKCGWLV
ncbi:NACHT, LRR and PYD domains-containing protein 12-like [Colossoma macropomum]|uniref:NACHT, LRR and PYD domains-containing protein 12-like n=1 Tax=Colossoma macropomum TaxID=42526 RepID=UPI001863DBB5|nr:NACHT, LRR and PYD domains-containing protein 12-like [Colossoma macropomum]